MSLLAVVSLFIILLAGPVLAATVPVIANLDGDTVTFTEDGGAVKLDDGGDATVTDDGTGYNGGNVTLALTNSTANDFIGVDGVNVTSGGDATIAAGETITVGVTDIGTVNAAPNDGQGGNDLIITLNANATDGLLSTLLQNLTFNNTSDDPDVTARTVDFTVADNGDGASLASTVTVNMTAVNDPPVITNLDGDAVNVALGGNAVAIDENGNATVTDVDSADFNGGNLTVAQATGTANGNFGVDGVIVTSGGDDTIAAGETITVGGTDIGTVNAAPNDGQGGNDLVITFNADATPARVQTLVRNLTYAAPSGAGARTFDLTVTDGDGGTETSAASTFTVNVLPPEINLKQGTTDIADGGVLDFLGRGTGSNTDITVTIENTGGGNLTLTTPIVIGGANADQFSIQQQPVSPVAPAGTTTFIVRFKPTTAGGKTATIAIANNDGNEDPYNLTLQGTGYEHAPLPPGTPTGAITYVTGEELILGISPSGQVLRTFVLSSADGVLSVTVTEDTIALDGNGNPLASITATVVADPPTPPAGVNIVGPVFSLGPAGATFDPPLTITFTYDDADVPPGMAEADLTIAFYNEATGEWTILECTVDPATNTITASAVSHFTNFTITGESPPEPAEFSVSNLTISPVELETGEEVTVSVAVANSGGTAGDYTVTLTVNGTAIDTTTMTLDAGGTGTATFTLSGQPAGVYDVAVNGLTGSYEIIAPPAAPEPTTPAAPEPTTVPTETAPPEETPAAPSATTPTATTTPAATTPAVEETPLNWGVLGGIIGGGVVIIVLMLTFIRIRRRG